MLSAFFCASVFVLWHEVFLKVAVPTFILFVGAAPTRLRLLRFLVAPGFFRFLPIVAIF